VVWIVADSHNSFVAAAVSQSGASMLAHSDHVTSEDDRSPAHTGLPHPDEKGYENLPQFPASDHLPYRRTIRRQDLRRIVPLADTTVYEMEQRGVFPRRFNLTARCVVWDLDEVQAWVEARKEASRSGCAGKSSGPDVRQRKQRPVRVERR
jgi:prophage regulatory protein